MHACVGGILLIKVNRLEDLEASPTVVHEDLDVQISAIVAIHGKPARLCKCVNYGRMSVEVATPLDTAKTELTRSLKRLAV